MIQIIKTFEGLKYKYTDEVYTAYGRLSYPSANTYKTEVTVYDKADNLIGKIKGYRVKPAEFQISGADCKLSEVPNILDAMSKCLIESEVWALSGQPIPEMNEFPEINQTENNVEEEEQLEPEEIKEEVEDGTESN